MRKLDAVVWDMDGTLFDSSFAAPAAYSDAVVASGLGPVLREDVIALYPIGPPAVLLASLLGRDATDADLAAYHDALATRVTGLMPYNGVVEALDAIRGSVPMAVFTGGSSTAAGLMLTAAGIRDHFDVVIGGNEIAHPKPAPDGLLLACEQLGVSPLSVAYVGDSRLDVRCARAAGSVAVAAAWGHQFDADEPCDLLAKTPSDVVALVVEDRH